MSRIAAFAALAAIGLLMAGGCGHGDSLDLYVAPTGNDEWSGTLPDLASDETDGPFQSLERARDEIRARRRTGALPSSGVTVHLRDGFHARTATFELTAEDSGTERSPIRYRASAGETVRLSGGRIVGGWQPLADESVRRRLPPEARSHVVQCDLTAAGVSSPAGLTSRGFGRPTVPSHTELFFQGRRMTLARWPNDDFVTIAGVADPSPHDDGHGTPQGRLEFGFHYSGDRPRRWADSEDVWVHGYWSYDWANTYERVASIDTRRRLIKTAEPYGTYGYVKGQRFFFLNVLEELDQPGEYYIDRQRQVLYFWPPAPLEGAETAVSVLGDPLVVLRDVEHVTLQGLTLEYTRGDGVRVNESSHVKIAGCTLRNVGNHAILVHGGRENKVWSCDIYQTGDGAIRLAGGDRQTLTPGAHAAVNNHIHHIGEWTRTYQPGVSLEGVGHLVAHNRIHDGPHNAIQLNGNEHVIEFNEIHHVCLETGDVGAFYMGRDWTERGNVVRHNFFHHLGGMGLGSMAVYLDDCASGTTVLGNIFYKTQRAVFIGGGRDHLVENNVFIDTDPAVDVDGRGLDPKAVWHNMVYKTMKERLDAMKHHEPPYSKHYPKLKELDGYYQSDGGVPPEGNRIHRNIIVGKGAGDGSWLRVRWFAKPELLDVKDNFEGGDPQFIDPENMNFQLQDGSPALQAGFQKIPVEKIGLQTDEFRKVVPRDQGR